MFQKKKICIIRNVEGESHASIYRILDAAISSNLDPILLTRSRNATGKNLFFKKILNFKGNTITNFELQLKGEYGGGLNNLKALFLYQLYIFFWLLFNRKKFDFIHSFDLDTGIPSLLLYLLFSKKFVYHIADFYVESRQGIPEKLKYIIKKIEFMVISFSLVTIICTEERINQVKNSNYRKLMVIHNSPVIPKNITFQKDINSSKIKIGYVGGLSDTRFIPQLISFVKKNQNIELYIGGSGILSNKIKNLSYDYKNIHFYGKISYNYALELYSKCNLIVSIYDPNISNNKYAAPNKVYEAIALEKPIIVCKNTGIDKLVEELDIGFSINYSYEEFENLMHKIINDINLINIKILNCQKAQNKYSWNKMKNKLKRLYNTIN
jgi:glycosyltransferase involved in cell wall biosynthesis